MNPFRASANRTGERTPILAFTPNVVSNGPVQTLRLYEPIDSWGEDWGISAREFTSVLDTLPANTEEIRLLINSPGGEVWDGLAILNALRAHPAKVTAIVEGIAASSASFIACGVDELVMMKNSELFIHNAWGMAIGDAEVMHKLAADLEHEDRNLASIYAEKTGGTVDEWLAEMSGDRWFSAEEAVAAKLADRVEGDGDATSAKARFDMSVFARAQRDSAPKPPSSPEPADNNNRKEFAMSDTLKADLLERLGITDANASDDAILAAVGEALDKASEPAPAASVTPPEGTTLIDSAVLADLQSKAEAGVTALATQTKQRRDSILAAALADGRIAPVSKDTWSASLEKDEASAVALLETLPKNAVPVVEIGAGDDVEASADDRLYNLAFGEKKGA